MLIIGGESEGSGFAIQNGGYILTNFHVIEFEPSPKVILPDNTFETATVVMADKAADLAVIKVQKDLPILSLADMQKLDTAEELLAIGFAMGSEWLKDAAVTKGTLMRLIRSKQEGVEYLQTDMTFIGGMSGGPMVNIEGDVVGVNTSGLLLGGMGLAISADTIREKWAGMARSPDALKDVQKTGFEPDKSPLEAVRAFYNYLKARKLEKAFGLLSNNFVKGYSFEHWARGYAPLLDTTVIDIRADKNVRDRVKVKLGTKDFMGDEVVTKFFEGYWDVRKVNGKWLLWDPEIRQVEPASLEWFGVKS